MNLFWPHAASICNGETSSVKKRLSQNKISILVTVTKNIADESLLHINEEPSIM